MVGLFWLWGCSQPIFEPQPTAKPPIVARPGIFPRNSGEAVSEQKALAVTALPTEKPTLVASPQVKPEKPTRPGRPPQLPQDQVPPQARPKVPPPVSDPGEAASPRPTPTALPEDGTKAAESRWVESEFTQGQDLLEGRGSQILYILVNIKAPKGLKIESVTDMSVILDISGSMQGKSAEIAIEACVDALSQARGADHCWLVAFAEQTSFLIRGGKAGNISVAEIKAALERCKIGGGTMLGLAMKETFQAMQAQRSQGRSRHMILVTDGGAFDRNVALDTAAEAWRSGISVSCIGAGHSDQSFLLSLAQRGHGEFLELPAPSELPNVLKRASQHARSLVARDIEVQIEFEPNVSLRRAFQVSPARELKSRTQGSRSSIGIGDLYRGEEKEILFELQARPEGGRHRNLGKVQLSAHNPDRSPRPPQTLPDLVARVSSSSNPNPQVSQVIDKVYARVGR